MDDKLGVLERGVEEKAVNKAQALLLCLITFIFGLGINV